MASNRLPRGRFFIFAIFMSKLSDKMCIRRLTILTVIMGFLYIATAFAQKESDDAALKAIIVNVEKDSAFDRVVDRLLETDFVIRSVDKDAGFIQARVFFKDRRILSARKGERRTLNFVLRPNRSGTKIVLQIYSEDYRFGGDVGNRNYYYEENGIIEDAAIYQEILEDLRQSIER